MAQFSILSIKKNIAAVWTSHVAQQPVLRWLVKDAMRYLKWRVAILIVFDLLGSAMTAIGFLLFLLPLVGGGGSLLGSLEPYMRMTHGELLIPAILISVGGVLVYLHHVYSIKLSLDYESFNYKRFIDELRKKQQRNAIPGAEVKNYIQISTRVIRNMSRSLLRLVSASVSIVRLTVVGTLIVVTFNEFVFVLVVVGLISMPFAALIFTQAYDSGNKINVASRDATLEKRAEILAAIEVNPDGLAPPRHDLLSHQSVRGYARRLLLPHTMVLIFTMLLVVAMVGILMISSGGNGYDIEVVGLGVILARLCWVSYQEIVNSLLAIHALLPAVSLYKDFLS